VFIIHFNKIINFIKKWGKSQGQSESQSLIKVIRLLLMSDVF